MPALATDVSVHVRSNFEVLGALKLLLLGFELRVGLRVQSTLGALGTSLVLVWVQGDGDGIDVALTVGGAPEELAAT